MDEVGIGGLRIAFEWAGEGPPLVLLHGAFSDSRVWRRQLAGLSDEFTVVAWDAPGCGRSSDPPAPETFRLSDYADCLAGFIDALDLGRPHVLGLSFGGDLALELYRRYPTVPKTLVLAIVSGRLWVESGSHLTPRQEVEHGYPRFPPKTNLGRDLLRLASRTEREAAEHRIGGLGSVRGR